MAANQLAGEARARMWAARGQPDKELPVREPLTQGESAKSVRQDWIKAMEDYKLDWH